MKKKKKKKKKKRKKMMIFEEECVLSLWSHTFTATLCLPSKSRHVSDPDIREIRSSTASSPSLFSLFSELSDLTHTHTQIKTYVFPPPFCIIELLGDPKLHYLALALIGLG
jgi:hypothetical protein